MRHRAFLVATLGFVGLFSGCGGSQGSNVASSRLEGAVTLDGKPIDGGSIQFVPQGQADAPVTEVPILGGRYVAPKVPQGKLLAMVRMTPPNTPAVVSSDYKPATTVTIPDRYKSGLPIEVKGDKSDQDIAMSSK